MREKNQEQKKQQYHRRLFLLKGVAYLSGALFGLNLFSDAKAGQRHIFPINTPPIQKLPLSEFAPRIAFIIDDIGSSISRAQAFLDLKMPMTFSILPKLQYSNLLAEEINEQGQEIMLHQPMEPYCHEVDPGPGALYVGDCADRILEVMEENISDVPFATGINNHMGSRFTSCRREMKEALEVIKLRGLFFVDSLTTSHSTAYGTARMLRMPAARRNIFLDNYPDESYVLSQLYRLRKYARRTGHAIGIGHPFPETAKAIQSFFNLMGESDISMVHISSLIPAQTT